MTRTRIAIIGCGAVTSRYYLPALASLKDRVEVTGVYDSDLARADQIASQMPGARVTKTLSALLELTPTIVVLASPPAAHTAQAIAAMRAGAHVLCEKPMALSREDAEAMAAASREQQRLLAVNMVRRHFPGSRIVEALIRNASLGTLRSISVFEGGAFQWPIRDQTYFSQGLSGGGVLADIGTHVVDLLTSWLGEAKFVHYEDDAMGGVEANALLRLMWGEAPATIRLSRDWQRPNAIKLVFDKARVRWRAEPLDSVDVQWTGESAPLRVMDEAAADFRFEDCFTAQLAAMLDRLSGQLAALVTAEDALSTVALIERAYREKALMPMPWLKPSQRQGHD